MRAASLLIFLAACDQLFGLDPVPRFDAALEAPPDGAIIGGQLLLEPNGDRDNDGEPNGSDLCVLIPSSAIGGREDRDGDGVGDLCDPRPDEPGDCLALFDDFTTTLSPHWRFDGEPITVSGGTLHVAGQETIAYLDLPLDLIDVYIEGYVAYGANGPEPRHAVQVFVDLERSPLVSGQACGVEGDAAGSLVSITNVVAGADTVEQSAVVGTHTVGAGTNAGLSWRAQGCQARLTVTGNPTAQSANAPVAPPPSGIFGVRVIAVDFRARVVVGYGRGCAL